nr:MAG TPA: Protein of unknown function (DUF3088) [Caudoviricetes sp.]
MPRFGGAFLCPPCTAPRYTARRSPRLRARVTLKAH